MTQRWLHEHRAVLFAVLAGAIARALMIPYWEGAYTDGIGRTIVAAQWLSGDVSLFGRNLWPELNYLLPAIAIRLGGGDLFWAPRILSAIISLALVPLSYFIARRVAGREHAAGVAWCAALLPHFVMYGTSGQRSEIPAAVGMLIAALGILRWSFGAGAFTDVVLAAFGVIIAEGMRFDAVLVGAALGFVLLAECVARRDGAPRQRRIVGMALFGTLCLAYPIALGMQWNALFGDPIYVLHLAQENSRQFLIEGGGHARWPKWFYRVYSAVFGPLAMAFVLTPVVAAAAVLGMWRVRRSWDAAALWAVIGIHLLFMTYNLLSFTAQPQIRYLVPLAAILLVFLAPGIEQVAQLARGLSAKKSVAWCWAAIILGVMGTEAIVAVASLRDIGVLSRQLGATGLVQPGQFVVREALQSARSRAQPGDSLLITAFAATPYSVLATEFRTGALPVSRISVYKTATLVYSKPEYEAALVARLAQNRFVLLSTATTTQGFTDGLSTDPLRDIKFSASDSTSTWRGVRVRLLKDFGSLRLLERL
jgi:hypothetical protein